MNTTINIAPIFHSETFDFHLPKSLACAKPTEERGILRGEVRLMVSNRTNDSIAHTTFGEIGNYLREGDVLIVNTSGTIKAALSTRLPNGKEGRIHLSSPLGSNEYLVEVRQVVKNNTKRFYGLKAGDKLPIPLATNVKIIAPHFTQTVEDEHIQLWKVRFDISILIDEYLERYGEPVKYNNINKKYPHHYYQTCFANEMGSAEMPSAGRAFTPQLVNQLLSRGIQFAPILLHTGISSLEVNEKPYPEYFKVSASTASLINLAKAEGRRIIAVGTTAIRAVESTVDKEFKVHAQKGMTNLFITPKRGLKVIDGMLTGMHEPKASHLLMMQALADVTHLSKCYEAAIAEQYQWHEFGDLHLIL